MRILFACKRRPQQRDLLVRPYGRFHYLPLELAALGHEVHVALIGHRGDDADDADERCDRGIAWSSRDIRKLGFRRTVADLHATTARFAPDWVIGCSDAWVGCLAARMARHAGARLALDAYDDYETYMPWNLPLRWAWRRAIATAELVTAAGPQLAARLQSHRHGGRQAEVVPMAADPGFVPMDRIPCREALGLPANAPLIGYSGSWARKRGTHVLLESFQRMRSRHPDARLVLSGRPPADACAAPGVISLGYLEDARLPVLLNALNVACIITADTGFGRYSYPAKLCEAMACGIPVVATATQPVCWMLRDHPEFLADVGNAEDIASRMLDGLGTGRMNYGPSPSWKNGARTLETMLSACN